MKARVIETDDGPHLQITGTNTLVRSSGVISNEAGAELWESLAAALAEQGTAPKVYVVVNSDRHYGTVTELWVDAEAAVRRAREIAEGGARSGWPITDEPVEGWLLHWRYGEDSTVWVVEQTVQSAADPARVTGGRSRRG